MTLFAVLACLPAFSQINAGNDSDTVNGVTGGSTVSVRLNDMFDGTSLAYMDCDETILTLLSTPIPGIELTQCGPVHVDAGVPAGTYTLQYQICLTDTPNVCDTATVTINVCEVTPVVIDSYTPLSCLADTSTIQISGLPESGTWTLSYLNYLNSPVITGTGPTTTLNFEQGNYAFRVTNAEGCRSSAVYLSIYPPQAFVGDLIPSFEDTNNDGTVSVGDHINYIVSLSNMSDCPITNIELTGWEYVVSGGPLTLLPPNSTDNTTFTSTYVLTQEDINNGMAGGWYIGVTGDYNGGTVYTKLMNNFSLDIQDGIHMVAFIDDNGNGIKDPNEQEFSSGEFTYQLNDGDVVHVNNGTGQHTIFETDPTNTFNIGYEVNNMPCAGEYDVQPDSYNNITVASLSGLTTYYFPITVSPCTDLKAYIYGQQPVPGFGYFSYVIIRNDGNQAIASGSYEFFKDPAVTVVSVSEASAVTTATGFTYAFTNLAPQQVKIIGVLMTVPALPAVALGDILTSSVVASVPEGDADPANNTFISAQEVIGAYDPNDKAESHGRQIAFNDFSENDVLTYTIRFENEGTANAHNIRIEDVLDAKLDRSTVRMVASSHNYVLERRDNMLAWVFDNIQLPPSQAGTMTGKGFVVFQVKPLPGYAIGDIISNNASIFFDTNPAIVTNTTTTEFVTALNVDVPNTTQGIVAYPNPVRDILYLETGSSKVSSIHITDVTGKIVMEGNAAENSIRTSSLSPGMYFVKIGLATGAEKVIKIIRE